MVEIVISRPPSTNRLWRMGRGKMFRSPQYMDWLDDCLYLIRKQEIAPIKGRYKIVVCVRRPDKRRRDIDNYLKSLSDLLQKAGVVEDDCLCQMLLCAWVDDGPDTLISICAEGEEHELSEAIARALQGSKGTPADERSKGVSRKSHPASITAAEYRSIVSKAGSAGRKGRKAHRL